MASDLTSLAMPGIVDLDSGAWSDIPLGMDAFASAGRGLIRVGGFWRLVIGSPAWGFFYGRATVPGWDAPKRQPSTPQPGGDRWEQPDNEIQAPGDVPVVPKEIGTDPLFDDMGNATTSTFSVTPGTATVDAKTGSMATTGASVTLTTDEAGQTMAMWTPADAGWRHWVPWILLGAAVVMVLRTQRQ